MTTTQARPQYVIRRNARVPKGITPDMIGREIEAEQAEHGVCSPRSLVDRERPEEAPLHEYFEWDDVRAAEEYRVGQARTLVRSVVIVRGESSAPAYVHVTVTDADDGEEHEGYIDVMSAMRDPRHRRQVLMEALEQLNALSQHPVPGVVGGIGQACFLVQAPLLIEHGRRVFPAK